MPSKQKRWRTSPQIQQRAQQLRRELTPVEKKLWARLRLKQLDGLHIRKQHAVGRFIVDFFYAKGKLVIEIDGDSHIDQVEYDAERTQWLNEQKHYRVIRFTNDDIHKNLDAVLQRIQDVVKDKG
jgi:very-short-patch-repair endonuclease